MRRSTNRQDKIAHAIAITAPVIAITAAVIVQNQHAAAIIARVIAHGAVAIAIIHAPANATITKKENTPS